MPPPADSFSAAGAATDSAAPAPPPHPAQQQAPIALGEFVVMVAALMALGALGVDAMLPALPQIGVDLHAGGANAQQFVISVYLVGLGVGQLLHGPLSDHFGRRPVMLSALAAFFVANVVAAAAQNFELLLIARFLGAIAAAATRVVTVAIVRDCYSGRAMARVMSLASMVFLIVPVIAPAIGQGVLLFGSWRLIFAVTAAATSLVGVWQALRLPETLARDDALPYSIGRTVLGVRQTLQDRWSLGYMLASAALQSALFGYITSIQQLVDETFARPRLLVVVFACAAGTMALANFVNSRLVMRLGSRLLSHSALSAFVLIAAVALALGLAGRDTLVTFVVLQALMMGCFSLSNSNFSAIAMTNMGSIAGTASSVQGFVTVTTGAVIGSLIGQSYAGTTVPLHLGFLLCGAAAFAIVFATERGRMFRPA